VAARGCRGGRASGPLLRHPWAGRSLRAERGWDYRLRLKGSLRVSIPGQAGSARVADLARTRPYLTGVELTAQRVRTNIGTIHDPGHEEPWVVAMSAKPGYLTTLDYARRWGIEPMFSDFKSRGFSRGFGLDATQIRYPDRLSRLVLVMALAIYCAVSTGLHRPVGPGQPSLLARGREARAQTTAQARPQPRLLLHPRTAPHRMPHAASNPAPTTLGHVGMN
jgi:hypothetical protein